MTTFRLKIRKDWPIAALYTPGHEALGPMEPTPAAPALRALPRAGRSAEHPEALPLSLLSQKVPLHDVLDVERFVAAVIRNALPGLNDDEFDELKAEGMVLMVKLANAFEPHRAGYERPGSFAGYASAFLPRRLGDAWHRMNPEHQYVTTTCEQTGQVKRSWRYHSKPASLDAILAASDSTGADGGSIETTVAIATARRQERGFRTGMHMVPLASPFHRPMPDQVAA